MVFRISKKDKSKTRSGQATRRAAWTWRFESPNALQAWGRRFARLLRRGDVVALIGPLGAGKTTLVQGIAAGLGSRDDVTSPTFALANEYRGQESNVYHMDMYRLSPAERRAFPLEDYWDDGISLVEWGDRVRDRWPEGTLALHLRAPSPGVREVRVPAPGARWRDRFAALK